MPNGVPQQYRIRAYAVTAVVYDGTNAGAIMNMLNAGSLTPWAEVEEIKVSGPGACRGMVDGIAIRRHDGVLRIPAGDWIVMEAPGNVRRMSPGDFTRDFVPTTGEPEDGAATARDSARTDQLAAFARRIVALDEPGSEERRTVNLTQMIGWAQEALGGEEQP